MRIRLSPETLVETVVTLAAAAMMTVAGFAMLEGVADGHGPRTTSTVLATPHAGATRG